ncbi:unnamed protein product [Sphenostylis stenocarpa]|uniref:Uncharacterized protein n=1 Tax=Sphenostylis stenocarpa TaxID=92480 RepID=A0AA86S969_9FABA|nr:unnamed protein product [Sphenostylis stenocarpa]
MMGRWLDSLEKAIYGVHIHEEAHIGFTCVLGYTGNARSTLLHSCAWTYQFVLGPDNSFEGQHPLVSVDETRRQTKQPVPLDTSQQR